MGKIRRTIKEEQFIEAYIKLNGNAKRAYLQVFPHVKPESAKVLGCNLLTKINLPMSELLDRIGVDDKALSDKLKAGLNSPNHYIVARYLDMAFKLKAKYPVDQSRLELTGKDGDPLSIVLREVVYDKQGKPVKKPVEKQDKKPITVEDTPF